MSKRLHKGDESRRRWKIIDASRAGDASLLPQLLARLDGNESYDNKRHIVRALGNIGGPRAEEKLIALVGTQRGLILGDIAHALGQIGSRQALPALKNLCNHELEWVRQNASFAVRKLTGSA
jgi:HEAT repeat protein